MAGKASPNRIRFTKAKLDTLPLPPEGNRQTWYDERRPELAVRVTSTGAKTFYVIRRVKGKPSWFKLGAYPTMTIEQAIAAATRLLAEVVNGADPGQARRALRGEPTLDEFFAEFWERHAKDKDSAKDDEQRYRTHIKPTLGKMKLSAVTDDDANAIATRMQNSGLAGATINRVKALLSVMFNKAAEWKICVRDNPAKAMPSKAETSRKRFLRGNEIEAFFLALDQSPLHWRNFISLSLLLGQREENTLSMRWSELDFIENIWRIPDTKNGEPHEVPLTEDAIAILNEMRIQHNSESPFVFPGTGQTGHLTPPKKEWQKILNRAGIQNLHLHDLRRTLGSWQAKTGVNLPTISDTLGHRTLQTTMIYARLDTDPVRKAMQQANDAIKAAGRPSKTTTKP